MTSFPGAKEDAAWAEFTGVALPSFHLTFLVRLFYRYHAQGGVPVSINLTTRQVDDVSVVDVAGKITLGEGASALRDLLHALVAEGHKKILLNLQNVTYIDSAGVGELVSGYTSLTNQGGTLKLLGLTSRIKDLLQITKLYTVFDVHETETHAVRSFAAAG
jgi:anti-sigma B factor antagonist